MREGKLQYYGMSSWRCFRVNRDDPYHLSLDQLDKLVNENIGSANHFEALYAPINVAMPEVFTEKNQAKGIRKVTRGRLLPWRGRRFKVQHHGDFSPALRADDAGADVVPVRQGELPGR